MPPNAASDEPLLFDTKPTKAPPRKYEYIYINMIYMTYFHIAALYGLYLCFTQAKWSTIIFHYFMYVAANLGITCGAHRLWSHRSYKAKWPLQLILMVFNSIAFQNSAIHWVRDHRLHHRYSDTDADPHNASRGFFFSHIGWLLVKKHPEVKKRGKTIDMSDIYSNPFLRFQKTYAVPFIATICYALPTIIPVYFWAESLNCAWHLTLLRYIFNLNTILLVNSAAHMWGNRPYDKEKAATQNLYASILTLGEAFHNYHHVFPWDYRAAELGNNYLNFSTIFIDFFAKIGWAYDLKTTNPDMIKARQMRSGDGKNIWGWIEKDISDADKDTPILTAKETVQE